MIKKISILFFLIIILSSCSGQKKEAKLVRESFDNYKYAILNDKGEEAVKYVDSRTISYYSEMLNNTKNGDSLILNSLGLVDKFMVLAIRHRTPKEKILSFNGEDLLVYAVKEGMVGKNSVANNAIGDVEIDGDFAKGQLVSNVEEYPFYFHFYKENGAWKIDLTSSLSFGTLAFKKMIEESGVEENEYLFILLEMLNGKKPGNEIWQPIK